MRNITKIVVLFALFIFLSTNLKAQSPTQPTYEKKVYVDADQNTYVQKSLPLYLSFSTTKGGTQHPLNSKASADYANPMYLDTEGINYIRSRWAVDKETGRTIQPQQEILFEIYADGIAPSTSIKFSGAPKYVSGKTYYGKGLNFDLTSRDGVSGVEGTHYALDANTYADYNSTVSVGKEGEHNLYYYAHDFVGNAEASKSRTFTVDISSPKSSSEIVGIKYNNNIIAPSTKFKLTINDNLSGVRRTYYSFDNGKNNYYGSQINTYGLSDGEHTLYYYAVDNVKNEETKNSFTFYLDKIAPVVENKVVGDQHKGRYLYVSNRTDINLSATDNKAGVQKINYNIDGGSNNTFSSNFKVTDKTGAHYINYTGTDNVENKSARKTLTVYMDNKMPSTGIKYGSPQFFDRDTLFINKDTKITLFSSDAHSGVQKTEYAVDGGAMQAYSQFTIPGEGNHNIKFNSTDNVNNVEQVKESRTFVDNTAPEIYANFSIQPIGTKDGLKVYPNYTRLYLGATDKHVGTEKILYSINGEPLRDYSSPYTLDISELDTFKSNKKYSVKVVSKDKLGNTSEKTIEFYVGTE